MSKRETREPRCRATRMAAGLEKGKNQRGEGDKEVTPRFSNMCLSGKNPLPKSNLEASGKGRP